MIHIYLKCIRLWSLWCDCSIFIYIRFISMIYQLSIQSLANRTKKFRLSSSLCDSFFLLYNGGNCPIDLACIASFVGDSFYLWFLTFTGRFVNQGINVKLHFHKIEHPSPFSLSPRLLFYWKTSDLQYYWPFWWGSLQGRENYCSFDVMVLR